MTGRAPPPMPAREGAWAIYEPFATADGEQIFVGLTSDRQWRRFCEHFRRPDLLQNPAYKTNEDRVRARPALLPVVADIVVRHKLHGACRTVRPHRYSIFTGRQARRPVRRSAAQCRRPHARRRISQRRARQASAPADRDRRSRFGAAPAGAGDRRAHRRNPRRARACAGRDCGAHSSAASSTAGARS